MQQQQQERYGKMNNRKDMKGTDVLCENYPFQLSSSLPPSGSPKAARSPGPKYLEVTGVQPKFWMLPRVFGVSMCFLEVIYHWLVVSTPLKNMKVSWDYDLFIAIYGKKQNVPKTTNQYNN